MSETTDNCDARAKLSSNQILTENFFQLSYLFRVKKELHEEWETFLNQTIEKTTFKKLGIKAANLRIEIKKLVESNHD